MTGTGGGTISVALCTYNGASFVADQLRSILNQDTLPLEIVIADDGSTDATLAIINQIARGYAGPTEIRLVDTDRVGGVTQNFDRAIGQCRGDIVVLCDQDDTWEPQKLAVLGQAFSGAATPRLVFSDATLIDDTGARLPGTLHESLLLGRRERAELRSGRAFDLLIRRNVVTGAVAAFSRDLYARATPFPASWVHDEWLAIIASVVGDVVLIEQALVNYRLHAANQIGVADPGVASRIGRMLQPRGDRYLRLRRRSGDLVERLESLAAPADTLAIARRKLEFESSRAAYPRSRIRRLGPVLRLLAKGSYARYSSQRRLDSVRDVLQPA